MPRRGTTRKSMAIILSPRGGGRGNSRQGRRWCRVARADRDSQVSALGVGLRSGAPFRCKHRIMHRKRGPGQRGPRFPGFVVGRGFAIWGPFRVRTPDSAPETWTWSTRSEGGRQLAGPQPRRKPDRVEVPNMLSGDTNSDPLPPVLIPTPIMPSCYRLSTPLSGSFLVFTSVSRWVCSGSTFVNLDRINPLLRFSRSR